MNIADIRDALSEWANDVTGREVVFGNVAKMGPRSNRDDGACSMLLSSTPSGHHEVAISNIEPVPDVPAPDITETSSTRHVLGISMNLLGGSDTLGDMQQLRASLGLSKYREMLWLEGQGIGFSRVSDFRDLSDIVKHEPEPRHQADWEFLAAHSISADLSSIAQVEITNEMAQGSSFTVGA